MAADLLLELERVQQLPEQYWLLELSADLQNQQYQTIQQQARHLLDRVYWLTEWPSPFEGLIIANEVLDAMPVHLVHYNQGQFQQYHVTYDHNGLQWQLRPVQSLELSEKLNHIESYLADDYILEINTDIKPWLNSVADILNRGLALIIDYGFPRHELYHPQRTMGTLMCHIDQRAHADPLIYPGVQDITTHVDFTEVAESALSAGLQVAGYTTQGDFLINCGITKLMPRDIDSAGAVQTAQQVKMLTMPEEMGELFKVMALTQGINDELIGFTHNDHRHRLG
jgi:SAM-dependent MidA family methyltransferase